MFSFKVPTQFWAPVTITTPDGEEQTFEAQFNYLDDKQWLEQSTLQAAEFLRQNWIGWKNIVDTDQKEIAFSVEQRDVSLAHTFIGGAVVNGFTRGRQGLRAKN